jgi:hypothetical protein
LPNAHGDPTSERVRPPTDALAALPQVEPLAQPTVLPSSLPPGWRAEDLLGHGDGFVSVEDAAKRMQVSEDRVVALVRAGLLEARGQRVRPAVVTVLFVRELR